MGKGKRSRPIVGAAAALLAVALLAAGAVSAHAAGFAAAPGSPLSVPGATGGIAIGDLNGDGKADAAVADPAGGKLIVLLGDGRGALGAAPGASVATGGTRPFAVALADLNGDAKPDAVVANDRSHSVAVLLGDGKGGLAAAPKSPFATGGTRPASLVLGDFNGDSKADVATVNFSSGDVSVLLGDGKGGLTRAPGSPTLTGGLHPGPAAGGDFDRDGKLDLVVGDEDGNATLLRGDGTGKLSRAAVGSPSGLSPAAIGSGDFNRDGNLDVAVANTTGTLSILAGNGAGGLSPLPAPAPVIALGKTPAALAVADLNNDGKLDLAVANSGGGDVSVLLGDGGARFAPAPGTPVASGGASPSSLAVGDLNGDAKPDLTTVNAGSATVSVLLNSVVAPAADFVVYPSSSAPGAQVTFAYSSLGAIEALDWDLNGDGLFDDAHGPTAARVFPTPGAYPVSLRVTDLDGLISISTRLVTVAFPPAPLPIAVGLPPSSALMAPFPIVRITGRTTPRGARIRELAVLAPTGTKVTVRCAGKGCPFRRWSRTLATKRRATAGQKMVTVRRLRGRFLFAGATLEVRISRSGQIGKYTKLVIQKRKPPVRSDLCLAPGSRAAAQCPAS
jgi:hypothetical protein